MTLTRRSSEKSWYCNEVLETTTNKQKTNKEIDQFKQTKKKSTYNKQREEKMKREKNGVHTH